MTNILNVHFEKIFVINLAKRTDRWEHFKTQLGRMGNPQVERFEAYGDVVDHTGKVNGNCGCTASHRALLELIAFHRWKHVLIFEDDAKVRKEVEDDTPQRKLVPLDLTRFENLIDYMVTEAGDYDMLYLGGSYGENPKRRHSKHVIQTNSVMTTSSYAVTWQQARKMAPYIGGVGPIDSLYHQFNRESKCFMIQPRLFVQYPNFSDLTESQCENETSMTDLAHEEMLIEGKWTMGSMLESRLYRRELAAPHDMDGSVVIVEGKPYRIIALDLPDHKPSWFRGEPVTYQLSPI